jgi:hypothetical protein
MTVAIQKPGPGCSGHHRAACIVHHHCSNGPVLAQLRHNTASSSNPQPPPHPCCCLMLLHVAVPAVSVQSTCTSHSKQKARHNHDASHLSVQDAGLRWPLHATKKISPISADTSRKSPSPSLLSTLCMLLLSCTSKSGMQAPPGCRRDLMPAADACNLDCMPSLSCCASPLPSPCTRVTVTVLQYQWQRSLEATNDCQRPAAGTNELLKA